ncbi:hypothetical protein [Flavobacterium sp.]|jgi:hypothetical protein|uniref:hypothetical protein n=1 Tax=Flavobacterium sp. TaxID=239 RepID=UPI0037BEF00C
MKNIKINKKLIILLFVVGITAVAFNAKKIFTKLDISNKQEVIAKPFVVKKNQKSATPNATLSMNPQQDIVGTWLMENSPSDKYVFTNDNKHYTYVDNVLQWSYSYEFVDYLSNGNPIPTGKYLIKFTDLDDGDVSYEWVFDVGPNPGDYLTLIGEDNGRMAFFIKQ